MTAITLIRLGLSAGIGFVLGVLHKTQLIDNSLTVMTVMSSMATDFVTSVLTAPEYPKDLGLRICANLFQLPGFLAGIHAVLVFRQIRARLQENTEPSEAGSNSEVSSEPPIFTRFQKIGLVFMGMSVVLCGMGMCMLQRNNRNMHLMHQCLSAFDAYRYKSNDLAQKFLL